MFRHAENRVRQCLPVFTRAYHFDIAAYFTFIAHQQDNVVPAVAQVKPEPMIFRKGGFPLFTVHNVGQRRRGQCPGEPRPACQPGTVSRTLRCHICER